MEFRPLYSHQMVYIPDVYNTLEDVEERASRHAAELVAMIEDMRYAPDRSVNPIAA